MANPFKKNAKTTEHINFWVEETFAEAAEKFGDAPVGAFVMVFGKTKEGNVGSVYRKFFSAPENKDSLRNQDLLSALDNESFRIRYQVVSKSAGRPNKK